MITTSQTTADEFDQARSEGFAERLLGTLNEAAVALMMSVGHRTGLLDAIADMPPATSDEIADTAGLEERYVREWLGAMVTARVVEHDVEAGTFRLPPEHAASLTRVSGSDNIAATMQWIGVLASVEDRVVDSFRNGGGVEYCHFHRFHEVMAAESAQTVVAGLCDHILPLVPGLRERLEHGIDVLDVGCGAGRAMNFLARTFPASRFTGLDLCEEAVGAARAEAEREGLRNACFELKDVTRIGEPEAYDLVTAFDAIHDQKEPAAVLREINVAIRPKGLFLMQDIAASSHLHRNMDHPIGPFLYTISTMHCMTVSLAQGGAGLGTVWGEEVAVRMLEEAGFVSVDVERLPHDFQNNYYLARKA